MRKNKKVQHKKKSTALVVRKDSTRDLASPADVIAFGKVLNKFIKDNDLSVVIKGNDYAKVDGWKFAGQNFGLTAIPTKPVPVHKSGEYITIVYAMVQYVTKDGKKYQKEIPIFIGFSKDRKVIDEVVATNKTTRELTKPYFAYECDCSVYRLADLNGPRIQRGTGFCSNLEMLKSGFDEYSVISTCETRSIGKAYRNIIGHVMKAGKMEPTLAEEMKKDIDGTFSVEADPKKPFATDDQFKNVMKEVIAGTMKMKEVLDTFTLTSDQDDALKIAEKK